MQYLCWICWLFWAGLPTLIAYPVSSSVRTDLQDSHTSSQWERYWIQYTIGLLSVTATALTLVGCLCCQRHRRPKGFQDNAEKCKQEFKDGNSINGQDSTFEHSIEGLELNVPRMLAIADRVQFEPIPVDRIISRPKTPPKQKPLPLSTTFYEERNSDTNTLKEPCREWFESEELSVPREKLKYLREIGHGWFGKVVEGRADLEGCKSVPNSGGVVVRILTEEATTKEKAWFLGEATPYLKLHHQNILALLGFCLETDPYLLLFESCPVGDLKGFLLSNRDQKSREALKKENVPTRMALEISAGLKHMHDHGFVHTDLSARNCLVASDLSAKLGDYGIGVEKYPEDYYVVADRALPIRWSAPESVECTETTIETREITLQANMWSYAVLLWEILTWGDRPYNDMSDEQVIQMLLSLRTDLLPNGTHILQTYLDNCPSNMLQVVRLCLNLNAKKRPNLDEVRQILLNEQLEYMDFEQRWESLKTNTSKHHTRSASLQDLRGSIDSDYWTTIVDDTPQETLQSSFRLGTDEPVKNVPSIKNIAIPHESGSETEEESWKGRIEQGVYTEKVKQKSKSVTDLMVLVHIDFDSDAELSMGTHVSEKHMKKKLPATGSDSDIRHNIHPDEFDEALRKLRDPLPNNTSSKIKLLDNSERPKLLTLTVDQGQTPILRLSLDDKKSSDEIKPPPVTNTNVEPVRSEKHVLRLLSKGDPHLPLLRYVPDHITSEITKDNNDEIEHDDISSTVKDESTRLPDNFSPTNLESNENNLVDVVLWNHALDSALEQKIPGFSDEAEFNEYTDSLTKHEDNTAPELVVTAVSAPVTPQSRRNYSVYNADDEFSNGEDLDVERKCLPNEDEEERKQLSTPDDEQSSDSGFRDKESCEEEESVCPTSVPSSTINPPTEATNGCTEEEQLQILLELDTILDAEYYATLPESEKISEELEKITPQLIVEKSDLQYGSEIDQPEQTINTISVCNITSTETVNPISTVSTEYGECSEFTSIKNGEILTKETKHDESINLQDENLKQNHKLHENDPESPVLRQEVEEENCQVHVREVDNHIVEQDIEQILSAHVSDTESPVVQQNLKDNCECINGHVCEMLHKNESEDIKRKCENEDVSTCEDFHKNTNDSENVYEDVGDIKDENQCENVNTSENVYVNINISSIVNEDGDTHGSVEKEESEHEYEKEDEDERRNDEEDDFINDYENVHEHDDENVREDHEDDHEEDHENDRENEDEDSSTMSLRSDNSYVSFGMEEEFVTAIRNELREKLPCAQMPVVELLETHDDENPSISSDTDSKHWDDEDNEESSNQGSGGVGISIRYNVYGTPLSPILEERESTITSESLMSNSRDASVASKDSGPSEDVLLVDTRTNKMILLEGLGERLQEDDRDTTNGDISEEENLEYSSSVPRSFDEKSHIMITSGGAPLPSPEEETKWQQLPSSFPLPLPLPLQDDLMSTSFAGDRGWGSQDEDEEEEEEDDDEEEDEDNSSSSGEFVWKRYDEPHVEQTQICSKSNNDETTVGDADMEDEVDVEDEEDDEEEEEEFTPSAWNATLAPHRSALRSPDKTLKSGDQKKSVWFKKQRYHCVYEYPKETLATDNLGEATTTWEPTSYADWEEMMDEPRLDLYPLDYDDANHSGNEEFFVSSSNRPFQFQTGDSKYVSQFFPGAVSTSLHEERDEVDGTRQEIRQNNIDVLNEYGNSQQHQLGELRHTRDRLKLNLSTNGAPPATLVPVKPVEEDEIQEQDVKESDTQIVENINFVQDQCILPNSVNDNTLPKVPREEIQQETNLNPTSSKSAQCDNQEKFEPTEKCSVSTLD